MKKGEDAKRGPSVDPEADPDLLTQVFFNLIDNPVQHTDLHGILEIGWRTTGSNVCLSTQRITLPTIAGDPLDLLIDSGQFEVESWLSQGSRFTMTLPA